MPDDVRASFDGPLPRTPGGADAAYREVLDRVVPYSMGNDHPRFWGWYMGAGHPVGNLADLVASVINPNLGGADHSPVLVEQQVVRWCAEAAGYPTSASGLLVGGASEANMVGLAVARSARLGPSLREEGMPSGRRFAVYGSTEVHSCHRKSCELLGLGAAALRQVPVHDDFTLDVDALAAAIAADREAGVEPLAVVASAGTVNTGAIDDLEAIADLCEREGLWFHVDGAIGGFLALSGSAGAVRGIERADSLALDLHKWMQAPIDVGLVLVRDEPAHRAHLLRRPHLPRARRPGHRRRRGVVHRVRAGAVPRLPGAAGVDGLPRLRRRRLRGGHRPHDRPRPAPRRRRRRPPGARAAGAGRLRHRLPALRTAGGGRGRPRRRQPRGRHPGAGERGRGRHRHGPPGLGRGPGRDRQHRTREADLDLFLDEFVRHGREVVAGR